MTASENSMKRTIDLLGEQFEMPSTLAMFLYARARHAAHAAEALQPALALLRPDVGSVLQAARPRSHVRRKGLSSRCSAVRTAAASSRCNAPITSLRSMTSWLWSKMSSCTA
jgi:hypothetical protein